MPNKRAAAAQKPALVAATVGSVTLAWALMGAPSALAEQAPDEEGGPSGAGAGQAPDTAPQGGAVLEAQAVVDVPAAPLGACGEEDGSPDVQEAPAPAQGAEPEAGDGAQESSQEDAPSQPGAPAEGSLSAGETGGAQGEPEAGAPGQAPDADGSNGQGAPEAGATAGSASDGQGEASRKDAAASQPEASSQPADAAVGEQRDPEASAGASQDAAASSDTGGPAAAAKAAPAALGLADGAEVVEPSQAGVEEAPASDPSVSAWVSDDGASATFAASGGMYAEAWGVAFRVTGGSQAGERWFQAERQADGSWAATVPASSIGTGRLVVTPYANVGSQPSQAGWGVELRMPGVEASLSLRYDEAAGRIVLGASDVSCPTGVTFVSMGLTGPDGTVRWYRLDRQEDGSWAAYADPSDFGWRAGTYLMEASICDAGWKGVSVGTKGFELSFGSASVSASLSEDLADVELSASGGRLGAAWNVAFEVQGARGVAWVAASLEDGAWKASLPVSKVGSGKAAVRVWANIGSSPAARLGSSSVEVPAATGEASLSFDAASGKLVASATGVACPSGVTFVSVGVISPAGTVKWYKLAQQPDGSWSASIDPADFNWQGGAYALSASICDAAWQGVSLDGSRADISFGAESLSAEAQDGGATLSVTTSNGGRYAQAWGVAFEVSGRSGTSWVPAARASDGTWTYSGAASQWGGGLITVSAWANIGSESVSLGSARVSCHSETPEVTATVQASKDSVLVTAAGGVFNGAGNVAFAVRNVSGEDGTAWFQAYEQADGSWSAEIPAERNGVGTCVVEGWATADGTTSLRASTRYTYRVAPKYVTAIDLGGGDYDVSYGMAGLKVRRVQRALGIGDSTYPRYLDATASAVSAFQSRVGLPATGVVDKQTWLALGLDEGEWSTLGAYASPVRVSARASKSERVEAMIERATEYLGDSYVWDAAGAPKQGVDCAGLVIQALYAAGVDMGIINPVTHSTTAWGDHDASNLYYYGGMERVSAENRSRGDLVYYDYGTGDINHVAIYLGGDRVIEALPYNVRTSSLFRTGSMWFTRPIAS